MWKQKYLIDENTSALVMELINAGWRFQLEYKHVTGFRDWGAVFWIAVESDPPIEDWRYGDTPEEAIGNAALLLELHTGRKT